MLGGGGRREFVVEFLDLLEEVVKVCRGEILDEE